ncbi:MAG: cardiolipin synthase [Acholeplasmatales bacterium]|nr:MAG: cardiolipin synthase [Acholeplasmatales bacterium]
MEKNLKKSVIIITLIGFAVAIRFAFEFLYIRFWHLLGVSQDYGFLIRTLFLGVVIVIWLIGSLRSDNPYQKLPWLLIFIFEPFVGILLFMSMGRSFKHSLRYIRRPLIHDDAYMTHETRYQDREALDLKPEDAPYRNVFDTAYKMAYHPPYAGDTRVTVLKNGEAFYPDLLAEIARAETFILMEFYIARSDTRGMEVFECLIEKASAGVQVKVILDAFGSVGGDRVSRKVLKRLKHSAVDLVLNDPIYFPYFNTRMNYRNHRKIVVIDGRIGYTGGMNLGDEYDNSIPYSYYFRDTQVKIEGAAVKSLTSLFFKDYYYNTKQHVTEIGYYPDVKVPGTGVVQVLQSGPDSDQAFIRDIYLKLIFNAKRSIKIMTPYMALDVETLTALKVAQSSGVTVDVIIPGIPDKVLVYKVTKFFASTMVAHGIRVHQYQKGFCHGKVLIVDDEIASIGSYNLDNRSAVIDFEITALFTDRPAVAETVRQYDHDLRISKTIDPHSWANRPLPERLFEGLLSLFTPII